MISLPTLTWLVPRGSSAPLGTWRWSPQWKWPRPRTAVRIPAFRFISDRHFQMTNLFVSLRKLNTILVSSIRDSNASQVAKGAHLRVKPHGFPRVVEKPKICECYKKIFRHITQQISPHILPWHCHGLGQFEQGFSQRLFYHWSEKKCQFLTAQ